VKIARLKKTNLRKRLTATKAQRNLRFKGVSKNRYKRTKNRVGYPQDGFAKAHPTGKTIIRDCLNNLKIKIYGTPRRDALRALREIFNHESTRINTK
jgi:hypothetical protein